MGGINMDKKELIKRLKEMTSAVDVYNLKGEILAHLEDKKPKEADK
jgi:hypothetical protein